LPASSGRRDSLTQMLQFDPRLDSLPLGSLGRRATLVVEYGLYETTENRTGGVTGPRGANVGRAHEVMGRWLGPGVPTLGHLRLDVGQSGAPCHSTCHAPRVTIQPPDRVLGRRLH